MLNTFFLTGGNKYWKRDDKDIEILYAWRPPYRPKPSNSIEMTAYAVLAALLRNDVGEAATIVRWLAAQRNSLGGYSSTQVSYYVTTQKISQTERLRMNKISQSIAPAQAVESCLLTLI